MLSNLLRFSVIAVAALFCAATSYVYDEVVEITPLPGESAVDVDQIPTLTLTARVEPGDAEVTLVRAADGSAVAGEVVQERGDDGYFRLRYVPAAPLAAATDYRLVVAGGLDGFYYYDPITNESIAFGGDDQPNRLEVPFSTRSAPAVRHTRRYDGHAHLYLSFSQDMDPQSFTPETVRVFLDGPEEAPLTIAYDGGPAHLLDITMRRVDFADAVVLFDGVVAMDGTVMPPETVDIAPPQ